MRRMVALERREQSMRDSSRLNNSQAAEFIGVSPCTLVTWRCTGRYSIPYVKVGKKVFYYLNDLQEWLESRKVTK
jgi:predicted site-specific integrase-resolvase